MSVFNAKATALLSSLVGTNISQGVVSEIQNFALQSPTFTNQFNTFATNGGVIMNDISESAAQLRRAIEEKYTELVKSNTLRSGYLDTNDITSIVKTHIPIGISFDTAEKILEQAGFNISSRLTVEIEGDRPNKYDVVASIHNFHPMKFGRLDLYVFLKPHQPLEYSTVVDISAAFVVSRI